MAPQTTPPALLHAVAGGALQHQWPKRYRPTTIEELAAYMAQHPPQAKKRKPRA